METLIVHALVGGPGHARHTPPASPGLLPPALDRMPVLPVGFVNLTLRTDREGLASWSGEGKLYLYIFFTGGATQIQKSKI